MMEGSQYRPRIFSSWKQVDENLVWKYDGALPDPYQLEHDMLFHAIREDKPHNETERCAKTVMTAIMGRMAAESGQLLSWEEALNSDIELAPDLDRYTWDSDAPVMPDARGAYPVAMPGITKVV